MQEYLNYQDINQQKVQAEKQQGEEALILWLLQRKFGILEPEIQQQIRTLSFTQLKELDEISLNFKNYTDLINYLATVEILNH
jgi:hypothetical protein